MAEGGADPELQPPVDHRLEGHSPGCGSCARSAPAPEAPARIERPARRPSDDRTRAAAPLPDLPGHSSRGRLERVLRARPLRRHRRAQPAGLGRPARRLRPRLRLRGLGRRHQRRPTRSGAHCHMSSVGICALLTRVGYAPVLQISCRDKNRIAIQGDVLGAAAMGVCQHPLPDRRRRAVRRPARGEAGLRPRQHLAARDRSAPCATRAASCPAASSPRRRSVFLGAAENPFAPPYDFRPLRLAKKIARRRPVHPDAVLLRHAAARALHGAGARPGPARAVLHPGRRRPARLGADRALDARPTCRASTSPTS